MGLTLRTLKGSRLTHEELDDNFRHFTGSHTVDGTVTATGFVGDGSGLTGVTAAADLTGTGVLSGSAQIAELGAGIISGSVQLDGERFGFGADIEATGSFTGSFVGDGSGLTGIAGGASAISGLSDVTFNGLADGDYLSYNLLTSEWKNVAAPATDLTGTGVLSGSNWSYTPNNAYEGWNFPGPTSLGGNLKNYGSGNAGLANIVFGRSNGSSTAIRFDTSELQFFSSPSHNWGSQQLIRIDGYTGQVSASLFSGSFVGDGSGLTGVTAAPDLTGTEVISGSNLSYSTGLWNFESNVQLTLDTNTQFGVLPVGGNRYTAMIEPSGKGSFTELAIIDVTTTPTSTKAQIDDNGSALFSSLTVNYAAAINGDIISLKNVNHSIASGEVFKVTAGNTTSEIFRVNGDKEMVINASMVISDFDGSTPASADFTNATEGVSGSFSGSFEGDGSGLTGLPAVNAPLIAGSTLPSVANSVTGSMVLVESINPITSVATIGLHIYTGAPNGTGWQSITLN